MQQSCMASRQLVTSHIQEGNVPASDTRPSASSCRTSERRISSGIIRETRPSITQAMRSWHRSLPTATLPEYPNLRALFSLTRSSSSSRTDRAPNIVPSCIRTQPPIPNFDSNYSGHDTSENECTVCRVESEVAMNVPTEACTHPPQVCTKCLQQVILAAVSSGDFIVGIMCPSFGCPHRLGYYDVQKLATLEVFERYDKLLLQDSLRADGSYILCVAPNCTAGQEHTGGVDNVIVTCHHCGTKQCFLHRVPWHEGLTCEEWDQQQRNITSQQEQKSEDWIQTGTKPCPGPGCGRRIQKIDGCDHLICKRPGGCGHQFCWECLAPWLQIVAEDNSRHYDNCRYYTGLPGRNPAPAEIMTARVGFAPPRPQTISPIPTLTPTPSLPTLPPTPEFANLPLFYPHFPPQVVQQRESLPRPEIVATRAAPPMSILIPPVVQPASPELTSPVFSYTPPGEPFLPPGQHQREPLTPRPVRSAWRTTEFPTRPRESLSASTSTGFSGLSRVSNGAAPEGRYGSVSAFSPIAPNHPTSTPSYLDPHAIFQMSSPLMFTPSTPALIRNSLSTLSSDLRTVAQIRSAATKKTNNSVKGASPLVAMRALERLAEAAHLKEQQGDLRTALFQFVQVGVLLQFVQDSQDYKQEVQNGLQGELSQMMQEFITGPFEGMMKSVHSIQQTLLRDEQADMESHPGLSHTLLDTDGSPMNRLTGGSIAERLRRLQETIEYGQRNQVPSTSNPFRGAFPAPHGPIAGPSTSQGPPWRAPLQIPSYNPMHTTITPQTLHSLLESKGLNILVLDVRSREQFDRERLNHDAIVCLAPAILMRPDINTSMIEGLQVTSPVTEQVLFKNRGRFDLVVIYDENSNSLGHPTSPMSVLSLLIFEREFHRPLKRPPMILIGGLQAWKAAVPDDDIIRRQSPSLAGPVPMKGSPGGTSPFEEETFLYTRPTDVGYSRSGGPVGASEPNFGPSIW